MSNPLSIGSALFKIIEQNADQACLLWLEENSELIGRDTSPATLYRSFSLVPRKIPKAIIRIHDDAKNVLQELVPGFIADGWSLQRLCRLYLLTSVNAADQKSYLTVIANLFINAEMNELVALYSSLPVLNYPDKWVNRCAEGIRSNISPVLEAIMYHNPYPAAWLDEAAWNQLVLKAFFTDKEVGHILGVDERANKALAATLFDYASERKAAGRPVSLQLWRLIGKFLDGSNFHIIHDLYTSGSDQEKKAAVLVCCQSDYEPAKLLICQNQWALAVQQNSLTWDNLNEQIIVN